MELANGKYVFGGGCDKRRCYCIGFTVGKVYEFKDGYVIDDDGDRRPASDGLSQGERIKWFEERSSFWTRVEEPKLVNGWYKCVGPCGGGFAANKEYYFKDGRTVDDYGRQRPLNGCDPQKYDDASSKGWFMSNYLVPVDSISDAIERVTKMAVACSYDHGDCKENGCPYADFGPAGPNICHDLVKKDCEIIGEPHEALKNAEKELTWPKVGDRVRHEATFMVYVVKDISRDLRSSNIADIELCSLLNNYALVEAGIHIERFWAQYKAFDPVKDGWNGSVVSTFDYKDAYGNIVLECGKIYDIVNGMVNKHSSMFIKNPSEFMKKGDIPVVFEVKGTCAHSPEKRFDYTGKALCKDGRYPRGFKMGYIYDFILGETADDFGATVRISRETFRKYFVPLD